MAKHKFIKKLPGAQVINKFRVVYLLFAEIKHSDWLKLVTGLEAASQSGLFQRSLATVLKNLFMTFAP